MFVSSSTTTTTMTTRLARVSRETARGVATRRGRSIHSRGSVSVVAKKKDEKSDGDESPRGFPLKKGPGGPGRGPGAAPLRMETDEQRRFGYGGDGVPPGGGGGGRRRRGGVGRRVESRRRGPTERVGVDHLTRRRRVGAVGV